jgi:hypothetical protein
MRLMQATAVQGYGKISDCPSEPLVTPDTHMLLSLLQLVQKQQLQIAELSLQMAAISANTSCTSEKCSV